MKGRTFAIIALFVLSLAHPRPSSGGHSTKPFEFSLGANDDTLLSSDEHANCVAAVREALARRPLLRAAAPEGEGEIQVRFMRVSETGEFPGPYVGGNGGHGRELLLTVAVLGGGRRVNLTQTGLSWRDIARDLAPKVERWAVENRPYIRP
jgi:hypothetical protein